MYSVNFCVFFSYDPEMGGFSRSPKFPTPVNMNFLFRIYAEDPSCDRSKQALKMCSRTLEMISLGGINDHVSKVYQMTMRLEKILITVETGYCDYLGTGLK